jgi:xylan 1,4-beta-xylosidase
VLTLAGKGRSPADCSPLTQQVGDRAFQIEVELELVGEATGGLLLFFDERLFLGMGIDGERMTTYRGGKASYWPEPAPPSRQMFMRITNESQIVTMHYSLDGKAWTRHEVRSEVSGYNANTVDNLLSLRPALFATGNGSVRFRNFRFAALP